MSAPVSFGVRLNRIEHAPRDLGRPCQPMLAALKHLERKPNARSIYNGVGECDG